MTIEAALWAIAELTVVLAFWHAFTFMVQSGRKYQ